MNVTNSSINQLSSILLDTNVILHLIGAIDGSRSTEMQIQLRIAALTTDEFLVTPSTLNELEQFFKAYSKRLKEGKNLFPTEQIVINDKLLHRIFDSNRVRIIDEKISLDSPDNKKRLDDIFYKFNQITPYMRNRMANFHDAILILTSEALSVPILSADQKIRLLAPIPEIELSVPFPFNTDVLREVSIDELMELSSPLRQIYKTAFFTLKNQASHLYSLESETDRLKMKGEIQDKIIVGTKDAIKNLNQEVEKLKESEIFWKKASMPDGKKTILWTVVECATGLLPFPVPTSPISYFIDVFRHKRLFKSKT